MEDSSHVFTASELMTVNAVFASLIDTARKQGLNVRRLMSPR